MARWIKSVWVEVWVDKPLVWVDKMRVGGMLGCPSLTQKSVLWFQERSGIGLLMPKVSA